MHTIQEFRDAIGRIDAETTRIAAKIDELIVRLQATGISEQEEHEVLDELSAVGDRLRGIGQDPDNPVPPTP